MTELAQGPEPLQPTHRQVAGDDAVAPVAEAHRAPGVSRAPRWPPPAALAGMQRSVGNAAVGSIIGRYPMDGAPNPHGVRVATGEILPPDFSKKSDKEKMDWISQWSQSTPPNTLTQAWQSLGDPLAAARGSVATFATSIKRSGAILEIPAFKTIKDAFERDTLARARANLAANKSSVSKELERLGGKADAANPTPATAEQDFAVQDVQKLSEKMSDVRAAKVALREIQVGTTTTTHAYSGTDRKAPVKFDPSGPPTLLQTAPGKPSWTQVNEQWRKALAVEAAIIRQSPSAAFFMRDDQTADPKRLQQMDVQQARTEITRGLTDLDGKIDAAVPLVGSDLKFLDFPPIHQQLLSGQAGQSGTPWAQPLEKAIGKESVSQAELGHLLKTLAIGTATAAAFILAEFATAGMATFLFVAGAAASGTQAAMAWDHYSDLNTAANATVDPDLALVSGEQVSSALVEAILATVFAFADAAGAAVGIRNAVKAGKLLSAARAGEALAAKAALKSLGTGPEAATKLAHALGEIGPHEVRSITGKSFQELSQIAGEGTPQGKMLAELAGKDAGQLTKSLEELAGQLRDLGKVPADQLERVVSDGIAAYGNAGMLRKAGGWKKLMGSGIGGKPIGKQLEEWRSGLVNELREFIASESKKSTQLIRTGTPDAASDVDVQTIGGAAASMQQRTEVWLAGRLGTSESEAKVLLDFEVFVDPTRAHLQDVVAGLSADVRAEINARMATFEKQMIFGARLSEAKAEGKAAVEAVVAEASAMGVVPFEGFVKLSAAEQTKLAQQIDTMVTKLASVTDATARGKLVEQISRSQAMINASHPDAYVGGGVRLWVTERPIDQAAFATAGVQLKTGLGDSQRVVAALSEGRWMQKAIGALGSAKDAETAALALRNLGKHGERVTTVLRAGHPPGSGTLKNLGDELIKFKDLYKSGELTAKAAHDLPALQTQARSLLGQLRSETVLAVNFLEADARALAVPAEEMAKFQAWVQYRLALDAVIESVNGSINAFIRTVESGLQVTLGGGENKSKPPTAPEPPNSTPATGPPPP